MSKGVNFLIPAKDIEGTHLLHFLWPSDMEIKNVWFVIISTCSVQNKKTSSFF